MGFRSFFALGLLLSLAVVLAGCAPPGPGAQRETGRIHPLVKVHPTPRPAFQTVTLAGKDYLLARGPVGKPGGTFYVSQIGDGPKTFNPWASYDATSSSLGGMLTMGLVETDAYTGEVYPTLAKTVEVLSDKKTYRITLRRGLTWSDGAPLTADDVVFTWNEIIKPGLGNPSTRDGLLVGGQFPTVQKIDAWTVVFKTAEPFSPFLRQLGTPIAPRHIFAPILKAGGDRAFSAAWGTSDAASHPERFVSSGMWLLDKFERSERVVFKRNPHFFMVDKQGTHLPYLARYVVQFVKDQNNELLQFEQGKLDAFDVPGRSVGHVRALKHPDFKLYDLGPATGTTFIAFNLNNRIDPDTGKPYVDPTVGRWLRDVRFRTAIDYALNRQSMVENILLNVGAPLFTAESLSSIFLNQTLAQGHPQDLEKSRTLLKEAGFTWNAQGQLLDQKNQPVAFTLITNTGNDQREATGVSIQQDLAKLGIKVYFKPMDFNVLVGKINQGAWEAVILGLTGSPLEPHGGVNVWKSDGALHLFNQRKPRPPGSGPAVDRYPWEAELDQLFDQGARVFEKAERQKIYDRYQEILYEQRPMLYLYSPRQIVAIQSRIQNADPTPLGTWHNLEEIWIKE